MFNHYHYWPEYEAYRRQEKLLEDARIDQLIRRERPGRPGLVARLVAALGSTFQSLVERPKQKSRDEFDLTTLTAERSRP